MPCPGVAVFSIKWKVVCKKESGGSGFLLAPPSHSWAPVKGRRDREGQGTRAWDWGRLRALLQCWFLLHESCNSCQRDLSPPTVGMWHRFSLDCALIYPWAFTRPASGVTTRWIPCKHRVVGGKSLSLHCKCIKASGIRKSHTVLIFNILNYHPFNILTGWQPSSFVLITFQYIHLLTVLSKGWP